MILQPSLTTRIVYFGGAFALLAFCAWGLFYTVIAGVIGVLLFGFAFVNACWRLFHPHSYATEFDEDGFRVYGAMGNLVHDVAWNELAYLTMFHGNGPRGPGTKAFLAWRCDPRRRGPGRQPWSGGGRNRMGEEFDGALPDDYLGFDRMAMLFKERADRAHTETRHTPHPVRDVRLESF